MTDKEYARAHLVYVRLPYREPFTLPAPIWHIRLHSCKTLCGAEYASEDRPAFWDVVNLDTGETAPPPGIEPGEGMICPRCEKEAEA